MEEKTYKLITRSGRLGLAFGIALIVVGTILGVLMILSSAKLLHGRKRITF